MFYPAFVCLFVCLSVSNLDKNCWSDLHDSWPEMYLWTRKNWLHSGSRPHLDPVPGIFWNILPHCKMGHFSTICLVALENRLGLREYLIDVSLYKEVRAIEFRKSSRSGPDSHWRRCVLSECACSKCLVNVSSYYRHIKHLYQDLNIKFKDSSRVTIYMDCGLWTTK